MGKRGGTPGQQPLLPPPTGDELFSRAVILVKVATRHSPFPCKTFSGYRSYQSCSYSTRSLPVRFSYKKGLPYLRMLFFFLFSYSMKSIACVTYRHN